MPGNCGGADALVSYCVSFALVLSGFYELFTDLAVPLRRSASLIAVDSAALLLQGGTCITCLTCVGCAYASDPSGHDGHSTCWLCSNAFVPSYHTLAF